MVVLGLVYKDVVNSLLHNLEELSTRVIVEGAFTMALVGLLKDKEADEFDVLSMFYAVYIEFVLLWCIAWSLAIVVVLCGSFLLARMTCLLPSVGTSLVFLIPQADLRSARSLRTFFSTMLSFFTELVVLNDIRNLSDRSV